MILSKGYYGMHTDFTASCGPVCNTSSALVFHFHMGNNLEARWDVELLHIKHLRSRHFVFAPTTTSWRLDKQQVVLRIVSIRLHAEPHSDTLLQSGRGLEGRAENVETGHEWDKRNKRDTKKYIAAFVQPLKKVLLGWRTWMEEDWRDRTEKTPSLSKHWDGETRTK